MSRQGRRNHPSPSAMRKENKKARIEILFAFVRGRGRIRKKTSFFTATALKGEASRDSRRKRKRAYLRVIKEGKRGDFRGSVMFEAEGRE